MSYKYVTVTREPLVSSLGFVDAMIAMFVLVWLAGRYHKKHSGQENQPGKGTIVGEMVGNVYGGLQGIISDGGHI